VEELAGRFQEMTVLVAEDESGEIVGTIAHQLTPSGEAHLRGMAVDPRRQGSGIAERLLAAAERELSAQGCRLVTLDTTEPLKRAVCFYRRCGYEATGRRTDFFGMALFEYAKSLGATNAV
jgi:amino-acid N-acetyltransferase